MIEFPALHSQRLTLREFRASDVDAVFNIFSRAIVTKYYNLETMQMIEQAIKLVERRIDAFHKDYRLRVQREVFSRLIASKL